MMAYARTQANVEPHRPGPRWTTSATRARCQCWVPRMANPQVCELSLHTAPRNVSDAVSRRQLFQLLELAQSPPPRSRPVQSNMWRATCLSGQDQPRSERQLAAVQRAALPRISRTLLPVLAWVRHRPGLANKETRSQPTRKLRHRSEC